MRLRRCWNDDNRKNRHGRISTNAPRGFAMKALSMYDEQSRKEKVLRRVIIIILLFSINATFYF